MGMKVMYGLESAGTGDKYSTVADATFRVLSTAALAHTSTAFPHVWCRCRCTEVADGVRALQA